MRLQAKKAGKERRKGKKPKEEAVDEMLAAASRAAHGARDKGSHTVSREAVNCVHLLRRLKAMRPAPRAVASSLIQNLQYLAKNDNPMIRSEARSLLDQWRSIPTNHSHPEPKKSKGETELSGMSEALKMAAEAGVHSPEDSIRVVETLERLSRVPGSLARDVVDTTDIRSTLACLAEHREAGVRRATRSLLDSWRKIL